jgi:hypothetical protein
VIREEVEIERSSSVLKVIAWEGDIEGKRADLDIVDVRHTVPVSLKTGREDKVEYVTSM